jgi:hypothetical protein
MILKWVSGNLRWWTGFIRFLLADAEWQWTVRARLVPVGCDEAHWRHISSPCAVKALRVVCGEREWPRPSIFSQLLSELTSGHSAIQSDVIEVTSFRMFVISQHFKIKASCDRLLRPCACVFPWHARARAREGAAVSADLPVTSHCDVTWDEVVVRRWQTVV